MANSARYHREKFHRFTLEAQKFSSGYVTLPNRYVDPETGGRESEKINLKGTGTILSYTIIHIASDQYAHTTPYPVAIIETDEGARLTAMVADCNQEDLKTGARVELVFRKIMEEGESGIINYGYKAILI
jgi:uncharacterized protein